MIRTVKQNFQDQLGYVGLLLAFVAFFGYYFYLTFEYLYRETWFFPRLIIAFGLLFVVTNLLAIAFREQIDRYFQSDEESALDRTSSRPTDEEDVEPKSYVLSLLIEVAWLVGYIAGVYYVGFFTTTFLYAALYIVSHRGERNLKTGIIAIGVALGLVIFLWLLFVELLNSAAVFRLGRFP